MAQEKLLFALVAIFIAFSSFAGEIGEVMQGKQNAHSSTQEVLEFLNSIPESGKTYDEDIRKIKELSAKIHAHEPTITNTGSNLSKYVFISSSMPPEALKKLFIDAEKANALLVLRGFKNNSYMETAKFFEEIIKISGNGAVIDPELFKKYKIDEVPSFVISQKTECLTIDCQTPSHDKIAGNISLRYAFDKLREEGSISK